MFAKIAILAAAATCAAANNFGDLSFLENEGQFKMAESARETWMKKYMRLQATRTHKTMAYFRSKKMAIWRHKQFLRWDHHLKGAVKARIAAFRHHSRVVRAHKHIIALTKSAYHRMKRAQHIRKVWIHRRNHARHHLVRAHKAFKHSVHVMHGAKHHHAMARNHYIKAIKHARHTHHKMVRAHHAHARAKHAHIKAAHAMHKAAAHRRHMHKLRKAAAKRHAHARHHFLKALKALHRSKRAAIHANHVLHKHAIKGMKAGHV
jgi:hypothetical protein